MTLIIQYTEIKKPVPCPFPSTSSRPPSPPIKYCWFCEAECYDFISICDFCKNIKFKKK